MKVGVTPLHYASRNGHLEVVELIIERDAQIIDVQTKVSLDEWVLWSSSCDDNHLYRKRTVSLLWA